MPAKILIYEHDEDYATGLDTALAIHVVEHAKTELAIIRELTSSFYDVVVVGIRQDRLKEGMKLIQILLVEGKTQSTAPVVVLSDIQSPAFIKACIKAGVADLIIYPENPVEVGPRVDKVFENSGGVGNTLVRVAANFLGPAAGVFIEKQVKDRLNLALNGLTRDHLPEFLSYLAVATQPILKEKVVRFIHRLEQVFSVSRTPPKQTLPP